MTIRVRGTNGAARNKTGFATLAVSLLLAGCVAVSPPPNIQPQAANAVSTSPQDWYVYYSAGMPPHPLADSEGIWSFEFPQIAAGHVNYIQTPFRSTTRLQDVTVVFRVESGAPLYTVLDPGDISPATLHIFVEQQGDDLSDPNGRWWAQTGGYDLGSKDNETITIEVPFTPNDWSNVFGQSDATNFSNALTNIGWIGITFGGQYFWGHGVALASGSSKFTLIDMRID